MKQNAVYQGLRPKTHRNNFSCHSSQKMPNFICVQNIRIRPKTWKWVKGSSFLSINCLAEINIRTLYIRDRASSCNIYAVQQDTQSVLMGEFYSALMLARHVSDLTGPLSGAFYKLYSQTLVCGNTVRTARHVQPLRNGRMNANTACKTLLMMDRWGPKHVELT